MSSSLPQNSLGSGQESSQETGNVASVNESLPWKAPVQGLPRTIEGADLISEASRDAFLNGETWREFTCGHSFGAVTVQTSATATSGDGPTVSSLLYAALTPEYKPPFLASRLLKGHTVDFIRPKVITVMDSCNTGHPGASTHVEFLYKATQARATFSDRLAELIETRKKLDKGFTCVEADAEDIWHVQLSGEDSYKLVDQNKQLSHPFTDSSEERTLSKALKAILGDLPHRDAKISIRWMCSIIRQGTGDETKHPYDRCMIEKYSDDQQYYRMRLLSGDVPLF